MKVERNFQDPGLESELIFYMTKAQKPKQNYINVIISTEKEPIQQRKELTKYRVNSQSRKNICNPYIQQEVSIQNIQGTQSTQQQEIEKKEEEKKKNRSHTNNHGILKMF